MAVNQATGTYTALPAVEGQVVGQGQVLYFGWTAARWCCSTGRALPYRTLSEGAMGADVTELNADLEALGYATGSPPSAPSGTFSYGTKVAVERLQAAVGVTEDGRLMLGQAVLLPSALRVTTVSGQLGGPAPTGAPVLEGTSTTREVTIELDAGSQSDVKVGDQVAITLPDNSTTPGVVSSVGTVAPTASAAGSGGGGDSTPTVIRRGHPDRPGRHGQPGSSLPGPGVDHQRHHPRTPWWCPSAR